MRSASEDGRKWVRPWYQAFLAKLDDSAGGSGTIDTAAMAEVAIHKISIAERAACHRLLTLWLLKNNRLMNMLETDIGRELATGRGGGFERRAARGSRGGIDCLVISCKNY